MAGWQEKINIFIGYVGVINGIYFYFWPWGGGKKKKEVYYNKERIKQFFKVINHFGEGGARGA